MSEGAGKDRNMEKIDVIENRDNFIGFMMFEIFGLMDKKLTEEIIERDKNRKVKPINVELKFNGHSVPFKKFIEHLEIIYDTNVKRGIEERIENMIPDKIQDIYDKLLEIEPYCDEVVRMIKWDELEF